ncbi:MAG: acetoacetyl-CoA reductase [Rhodococcus sp. (in: high G+C Gram-positive bacteria)]
MGHEKVAIVTGGTRGIGASISAGLTMQGIHVAAGYSTNMEAADALVNKLRADGASISLHRGNVGVPEDCSRVVAEILEVTGRVDYLINNAGINIDKTVSQMSIDEWHAVLRINLSGSFYMTKAVLDHMIKRRSGRIVNISSVIGQKGNIGQAHYAASKAGLFGFSKSLALEVARKGITVNCVAPGYVDTDMVAAVDARTMDLLVAKVPVGRIGRGSEIARAVEFLVSEEASYITGSIISVNGGLDM